MKKKTSFKNMSENIISILYEILDNDDLLKYVYYKSSRPLEQDDLSQEEKNGLINNYIHSTPYTPQVLTEQKNQLRVFYPNGELENRIVLETDVVFQIIVHRDLWLIGEYTDNDEYKKKLRPYQIMDEIIKTFQDKTVDKLGVMHFVNFVYRYLNEEYGMYELFSVVRTI